MTPLFRAQLVLMMLGRYAYGDHVSDPYAYSARINRVLSRNRKVRDSDSQEDSGA